MAVIGRWETSNILPSTDPLATGNFLVVTVPGDESWEIAYLYAVRTGGAALTVGNLLVVDIVGGTNIPIKLPTAASAQPYDFASGHLILLPGWCLYVNVAAYGAGDTFRVAALFKRYKDYG